MEWGTLAVAALGAVFGVGATVVADVFRSRREQNQQWTDTKRAVYVRFLMSLAQAHSRMVVVAFREQPDAVRRQAVHDAFHNDPQQSDAKSVLRELAISAPDHIYRAAQPVYDQLRIARDLLAEQPVGVESAEYQQVIRPFFTSLEALQQLMRDDLKPTTSRRAGRA
ncbi:hypothetical protein [Streptomyces sp. NBC_00620]|uniref:hypothetical protein n=1 Tax=unclassified Streptomyces TaxID=2593676 RepID=UPI00224C84F7|nr:hypothetical protein [Streptomyces sp. NBC_00620]MCX4973424.1 hypothetical protein [Streptomyces sp. NBC_00620]WUC12175.1 hypothetical protein OG256_20765 [Streptomyces sp. NBC_00564]WUC51284.1 hypothetical protein OG266_24070 [Streptomyces sp. NBC_00554]